LTPIEGVTSNWQIILTYKSIVPAGIVLLTSFPIYAKYYGASDDIQKEDKQNSRIISIKKYKANIAQMIKLSYRFYN
jgi:hypothetical protein